MTNEHAASDYDQWFHAEPDSYETEAEADAAYMAALEEVYQQTLIHVGKVEEHSRQIQALTA